MRYTYHVAPFVPGLKMRLTKSDDLDLVASALQDMINAYAEQGWEFYRMAEVDVSVTRSFASSMVSQVLGGSGDGGNLALDLVVFRAPIVGTPG